MYIIQWNLRIKDTLGPCGHFIHYREAVLFSEVWKSIVAMESGTSRTVLSREAVLFAEGPLSEVPLYCYGK